MPGREVMERAQTGAVLDQAFRARSYVTP